MPAAASNHQIEVGISICDKHTFNRLGLAKGNITAGDIIRLIGLPESLLASQLWNTEICSLHYGNEFCESLIPSLSDLGYILSSAEAVGLKLRLATPLVSDHGLEKLRRLFCRIPQGHEIIINDWGVLRLLRHEFPSLIAIAGRQLCKTIKDPRLPSPEWASMPLPVFSDGFMSSLKNSNISCLELDVPPFAEPADFAIHNMKISVHAPYGFVYKSRICRIGSLHLNWADKFIPGHACKKECLTYICEMKRTHALLGDEMYTFERGNAMFYRHSQKMVDTLSKAIDGGTISRIILSGDWNENRNANSKLYRG